MMWPGRERPDCFSALVACSIHGWGVTLSIPSMPIIPYCVGHWIIFFTVPILPWFMKRLPHIGSDHFPVYVILQTGRVFEQVQEELEQTDADEQQAQETIKEGIEKAEKEENQSPMKLPRAIKMQSSRQIK